MKVSYTFIGVSQGVSHLVSLCGGHVSYDGLGMGKLRAHKAQARAAEALQYPLRPIVLRWL